MVYLLDLDGSVSGPLVFASYQALVDTLDLALGSIGYWFEPFPEVERLGYVGASIEVEDGTIGRAWTLPVATGPIRIDTQWNLI